MKKIQLSFLLIIALLSFSSLFVLLSKNVGLVIAQTINTTPPVMCPNCYMPYIGNRLAGKDLSNSYLNQATIGDGTSSIDLTGSIFDSSQLDSVTFYSPNMNNMRFKNASMIASNLSSSHGNSINFKNTNLSQAVFDNSVFTSSNFTNANLYQMRLISSDLTGSNMTNINGQQVEFTSANLTNVNFTNANLNGAINMSTTNISGATWSNTTCPDGSNSDNNGNTCVGHF